MLGNKNKSVAVWLFICCFMVFCMVVVGGLTRLTESGLSMTSWKPVTGFLPPVGELQWEEEFKSYQQSPEFQHKNSHMGVEEFKEIFWLEFVHRLLGRLIGLVFFIPFFYFLLTRKISSPLSWKLFGIFILGGVQGVIGWYMVQSGLVDDPKVSPFRLALHLGLACIIFALLLWQLFAHLCIDNSQGTIREHNVGKSLSFFVTAMIFLQIIAGAFVAGLDAGLTYNSFPLMDGDFVPVGYSLSGMFEDIATVQFNHRWFAFVVLCAAIALWIYGKSYRFESGILVFLILVQIVLGISTLLNVVPIHLASAHQALALIVFSVSVFINWKLCARVGFE